ncbi:D-amino-acid transaminase [uncultured Maritalea sp.]|uniref:D-amino-acid transaminase n=1 Tax=uncultured Maritalea sp. TaxID=757249 RepID=UPI00261C9867|nr:D-amino-acid transaminase [uncultured Maritalea sp.]
MRQIYINGEYVPENEAKISVFDRGFLFADAVYEVTFVMQGKLVGFAPHIERLRRSLRELEIDLSLSNEEILDIHRTLVKTDGLSEGLVYIQVTRGTAERDFLYPRDKMTAGVVMFTQQKSLIDNPLAKRGMDVLSYPDLRWGRRDIKTVQLTYSSMIKNDAVVRGAHDAWMHQDGVVTEGTSNNAYIVTADDQIVTRDLSNSILHGITRQAVLECADELGYAVSERPFTLEEVKNANEAFSTSASGIVTPVVALDGHTIGTGTPGPMTLKLREAYLENSLAEAI